MELRLLPPADGHDEVVKIAAEYAGKVVAARRALMNEYPLHFHPLDANIKMMLIGHATIGRTRLVFKLPTSVMQWPFTMTHINNLTQLWKVESTDLAFVCTPYQNLFMLINDVPPAINRDKYPHSCPTCRSPAYIGFNMLECSKVGCRGLVR